MSDKERNLNREQLLQRVTGTTDLRLADDQDAPLTWNDLGLLSQGLSFGGRSVRLAAQKITQQYDLGPRGAWMLNLIEHGVVFPHELSDVFRIGRSLVSIELARLDKAGLVESRPGETDRRRTELSLTPKGKAAVAQVRDEIAEILRAGFAGYSPREIRLCARMLMDLKSRIDAPDF